MAYLSALGPGELQELILELEDLWHLEPPYTGPGEPTMGVPLWSETYTPPELHLVLVASGERRVQVMKTLRERLPRLGLAEVVALVEAMPSVISRDMSRPDAEALRAELEALGAKIEIREA